MKQLLASACAALLAITPVAACNEGAALELAVKTLPETAAATIDVAEQQSVEGGTWEIYNNAQGLPENITRTDYGEMGRQQLRLAIFNTTDYLIKRTKWIYSAPNYMAGGTIREEIDYIEFCGSKLDMPKEGEWAVNETYEKLARESADAMFKAPEIAAFIAAAKLKPPLWK